MNKVHLFLFTFESCCTVYGMMHLFKWMSSYYWFFLSFFFPFFFYGCVTGVVQQKSLALAHLHIYWLWKELGHALPTVAVVKLRHGFTRETLWSLSPSFWHPRSALWVCTSPSHSMPKGQLDTYPPSLTLFLLSLLPHPLLILTSSCKREQEAGIAIENFDLFMYLENW